MGSYAVRVPVAIYVPTGTSKFYSPRTRVPYTYYQVVGAYLARFEGALRHGLGRYCVRV